MLLKMMFTFWIMLLTHTVLATDNVIVIDQSGSDTPECCACVDEQCPCPCSNLSLALTLIQDNTEIRITSDIPLYGNVEFGNVSSIIITGHNNPTIMCDHQGGVVGDYVKQITILNVTWDKCHGITVNGFVDAYVVNCTFQHFTNFALTLHGFGSIHINGTSFSHNDGGVDALATSVHLYNSNFYYTIKNGALHVNTTTVSVDITIVGCNFTNNFGYSTNIIGNRLTPNLLISSCSFDNNYNSGVVGDNADIRLDNVTFYNNVVVGTSGDLSEDGAAIRVYNSTVSVSGPVMFCNNKADNDGGAVYLLYSSITLTDGVVVFYNNTASNGGAVYIGRESNLHVTNTQLQVKNNTASLYGGGFYVHISTDDEIIVIFYHYYYLLLNSQNDFVGNEANRLRKENNAYFHLEQTKCDCKYFKEHTFSSDYIYIVASEPQSYVSVNSSNFTCTSKEGHTNCQIEFHPSDIHIKVEFDDCFGNDISPTNFNCSLTCSSSHYDCFIDSKSNFRIVSNDSTVKCPLDGEDCIVISSTNYGDIVVAANWNKHLGDCDKDIAHVGSDGHGCLPLSCDLLSHTKNVPEGLICLHDRYVYDPVSYEIAPGYWFDNGFKRIVQSCPPGLCDNTFDLGYTVEVEKVLPDKNNQCNRNWTGLACGECNSSKYSIIYDTTDCVPLHKCWLYSFTSTLSFLLILCISLLYWCFIILFMFALLHFQFDVTAGYGYCVIFYYSVFETFINMIYTRSRSSPYHCGAELTTMQILSFFSNIGNLKPPFLRYLKLCLHRTEIIDHVYLSYLHPLIVTTLVVLIFVAARRFVTVYRYIGRFVNSKSICLLLLLSYSSVCYTSVQLLKPLVVYRAKSGGFGCGYIRTAFEWQTYLSPTKHYFNHRHILYGIIAILFELIIGIGLPLVILTQRYLIRYFNLKLISIKPIIDQLQGCYKEEYRWFAAYYLICRQVIYATDIVTQFLLVNPSITVLIICTIMFAVHLWFQPYKRKGLNLFDSIILLTLILLTFSGFYESGLCSGAVLICTVLPIIFLVNYLALSSKLKHLVIPFSFVIIIVITYIFVTNYALLIFITNFFSILFFAYLIFVLKCICAKIRKRKTNYVMIDAQHFDINENDGEDDNSDSL